MPDFRKELKFAKETAVAAGDILLKGLKTKRRVHYKGRVDLVTQFDLKAEKYIVGKIGKAFPRHSILAEEGGGSDNHSDYKWIIDPLDGTTNFAHGYPAFCVSIGLEVEGRMMLGAIYNPVLDELFYASKGKGAFLNRRRIHVSEERKLSHSLLATGFPYDIADTYIDNLDNFARMYKASRGIRRAGSAALDLCYLACGRFDGFWELKLHAWDTAAGIIIVSEAGGRITDLHGGQYSIYDNSILATNGKIHNQMQKVLVG
ncbi:MAG: inositol monophosphatase family protein [candidate division Zixibacteria bacterium]